MTSAVHKFGGSSLSNSSRYHAVANIIHEHCQAGDVIVVSAAGKTTDTLVKLWQCYQAGDALGQRDVIALLEQHQSELISELLSHQQEAALETLKKELSIIEQGINHNVLKEAELLAHGELWSARLLAQYLNQLDIKAQDHDARNLITLVNGELVQSQNEQACQCLNNQSIHVVTGFIAQDGEGNTITLGRNGSDYSATLIASYIKSDSVTIWTDTQGVFSTDPRKVEKAVKYTKVCRGQAHLLARLGNPVLHAKTLSPLKNSNIKLVVRSSYDGHSDGTEVVKEGQAKAKRFITNIDDYDVIKVNKFEGHQLSELSLTLQHPIHHFKEAGSDYLLISAALSSRLVELLDSDTNLVAASVSGVAVVSELGVEAELLEAGLRVLEEQSIQPRIAFAANGYAIILTEQALESDVLTLLHDAVISVNQELAIVVAGLGNVGSVFIEQLKSQLDKLTNLLPVRLVGLVRSQKMLLSCQGVDLNYWQLQFEQNAVAYDEKGLVSFVSELDYEHKVVIDITASEPFSQLYPEFVLHDCNLISANKYAGTAEHNWYQNLVRLVKEKELSWRYNTSVGAGLPINFSLQDLQNSGDKIEKLSGVFSGTLSWLGSQYDGSQRFSDLVLQAKELGYTEPDPREDLSGRDVQRKLLILARELGLKLDLNDIALSPWMPEELAQGDWESFLARRALLDNYVDELAQQAAGEGKVLRYLAELTIQSNEQGTEQGTEITAEVGLKAVSPDDVVATLKPGDNIFVINSQWYQDNALVIQGPGAGKEVTAAGVHSDLYWLCRHIAK